VPKFDAVVVGSGPNGLAAAITLAQTGHGVIVYEAEKTIGGGARSAELTLPGFVHDVCSSVHPWGISSSFFQSLPLHEYGLRWIQPAAALAHPFDDGSAIILTRSLTADCAQFGADAKTVASLFAPLVKNWQAFCADTLRPIRFPRHPFLLARFGLHALSGAAQFARAKFATVQARGVFAGMAAHTAMPLDARGSSAFGQFLWASAHATGWPFAAGGSQVIANALAAHLRKLGGEIKTDARVNSLKDLPEACMVMCDATPRQLAAIAGDALSQSEREKFQRHQYGPGVFKVDWALDAPIPWNAKACAQAGTVHIGGTLEEMTASEAAANGAAAAERPFVLLAQPSLFDPSRAPAGKHVAWGYCHVPQASTTNMLDRIETQIERFAGGFKSHIISRSVMSPADLENHNANLIGGDISGGALTLGRLLRNTSGAYKTSDPRIFMCSSSTPPGPGVHGLCGHFAAKLANSTLR
jgi:phytoene dehydrogenase-like protein